MSEDELEKLKREKMKKAQRGNNQSREMQEQQARKRLKKIASQILTDEARSRLGNIRVANPDMASTIELRLVQLHKMGSINGKITDDQLKNMLKKLQENKDSTNIKY